MELVTRNAATQMKTPPLSSQRRPGLDLALAKRLLDVIDGERGGRVKGNRAGIGDSLLACYRPEQGFTVRTHIVVRAAEDLRLDDGAGRRLRVR